MHNLVGLQRLGESIELELFREGAELSLSVMMQPIEINKVDGERIHAQLAGAVIGEMREQHLQSGRIDYLQLLSVAPDSNAEASGFLVDDILYSINKELTRNFEELFTLINGNAKGMVMNIQRGNRELYILLK